MFVFKDKNSNDMGVYVREESFLGKAPMKHDSIHIDGRSGEEIVELGYENFEGSLNDVVITKDNRDDVLNWLSGKGELVYLGKKTNIRFLDSYVVAKHKMTFGISFVRNPFWYKVDSDWESIDVSTGEGVVNNEGSVYSTPLIKLVKKEDDKVSLEINGTYFEYDFKGEEEVIIDCDKMNAYKDNLLRNRQLTIGFEFPKLNVGNNIIKIDSGSVDVFIKEKDRWL